MIRDKYSILLLCYSKSIMVFLPENARPHLIMDCLCERGFSCRSTATARLTVGRHLSIRAVAPGWSTGMKNTQYRAQLMRQGQSVLRAMLCSAVICCTQLCSAVLYCTLLCDNNMSPRYARHGRFSGQLKLTQHTHILAFNRIRNENVEQ